MPGMMATVLHFLQFVHLFGPFVLYLTDEKLRSLKMLENVVIKAGFIRVICLYKPVNCSYFMLKDISSVLLFDLLSTRFVDLLDGHKWL